MDRLHADDLGNYANFLHTILKDHDAAEAFYKRTIEADPKHAGNVGNYAAFLHTIRGDHDAAEAIYQRALDLDSNSANRLGNYGQCLIGCGRSEDGLKRLRSAWEQRDSAEFGDSAELAYSLWLCTVLVGKEEKVWERVFKHFINVGFKRHMWNFDAMLAKAENQLESAVFNYAKSLAEAFLDETKVPVLENFERWKRLQPLEPSRVNAIGTIREG